MSQQGVSSPKIALSDSFMESLGKLPPKIQKRVHEAIKRFREDPTSPGLNYETLATRDPNLRSIRATDAYRIILAKAPKGDLYLFVWVDQHDPAYDWAKTRRIEVNPKIGALQIYDETEAAVAIERSDRDAAPKPTAEPKRLFDDLDDVDLGLCGVPAPLVPAVRALWNDYDLDLLAPHLPGECSDALYMMAAGHGLEEAVDRIDELKRLGAVDVQDFATAIDQPDSRRRIRVAEGEDELSAMLEAPLERWRVFLHPSQERVVTMNANGPMRVLGGAGTGKTVALMHRAKHLASSVLTGQDDRILVTTFTRNLAHDIENNLTELCRDEMKRVEVAHLHLYCVRFLRAHGKSFEIVSDEDSREIWQDLSFEGTEGQLPVDFLADEWAKVVQGNGITTRAGYLKVRRVGRGTPLDRRKRGVVWGLMEEYRRELERRGKVEWADIVRMTLEHLDGHPEDRRFRAVLADEVQDFKPVELRLLRVMAPDLPNSLFLTGDAHQRIYGHVARLSDVGIDIRGRARRLRVNYRTTQRIRNHAVAVLKGLDIDDLDGGIDDLEGYHSLRLGDLPLINVGGSAMDEEEAILSILKTWLESFRPEEICVACRRHVELTRRYRPMVESLGVGAVQVSADGDSERSGGIRLATMHRLKGLEYPCVLVAGVQEGNVPLDFSFDLDEQARRDHEDQERRLLYVAMTRARDQLSLTGHGPRSKILGLELR